MTSLSGLLTPYVLTGVRRRAALTIAAALGLAQYLVRVWSPPQLRDLAIHSTAEHRALGLVIVWLVWMRITRALPWRLVLAGDVRHLRHLPIAPWRWQSTHASQLLLLDVLVAGVAGYGLMLRFDRDPSGASAWWLATVLAALAWRVGQCVWAGSRALRRGLSASLASLGIVAVITIDDAAFALLCASGAATWAWWRLGRPFDEPAISTQLAWGTRGRELAIPRLWLAVAWHGDGAFVRLVIGGQLVMIAASCLACVRVGVLDPPGAIAAVHLFAVAAAALATWAAIRVERRIAVDRWALDPLIGSAALEIRGRLLAALVLASPIALGTLVAAATIDHPMHVRALLTAPAAMLWSAAATLGVTVRAQLRDRLHEPPILAQLTRLFAVGTATALLGPLALVLAAAIELVLVLHRWPAADLLRRRRYAAPGEAERG